MSKKPKTPDVAAVWQEVKGISNGLAALRTDVALSGNRTSLHAKQISEAFDLIKRLEMVLEEVQLEIAPRGFNRPPGNSVKERLDKHEAWITGLQNAEIDAQAVGEQIGEAFDRIEALEDPKYRAEDLAHQVGNLQNEVDNLKPLHTSVSMLEAKVAALTDPRSQSEAMLDQARSNHVDSVFNYTQATNRRMDAMQSVVTVLVIVQVFTVIAGLAWVLGVQ